MKPYDELVELSRLYMDLAKAAASLVTATDSAEDLRAERQSVLDTLEAGVEHFRKVVGDD